MFLHPWAVALGVVAAGLPVAIHFLTRPKPRTLPFSALRFVRELVNERKSRHRLRDAVILALRTAAVLLLAAAIARPLLNRTAAAVAEENAQVVRVVLLDVSQSLGAVDRGVALFERARSLAARRLEQRTGLKANLVFVAAKPRGVFERPASNFALIQEELSQAAVTAQQAQVQSALNLAAEMFAAGDVETRRELVIVSDFQRTNWAAADFRVLPAETAIELESVAPANDLPNLGLLRVAATERPEAGREFRVETDIGNYSPTPRQVRVELTLGMVAFSMNGLCPPFAKTTLSGTAQLAEVGWHLGQAKLVDVEDSLAADNARPFVVEVRPATKIGLLTRQSPKQRPSSSYYLERALAPVDETEETARNAVQVTRIDPAAMDRDALAAVDLLLLDHPGRIEADGLSQIASLLRRGRGVLYVTAEAIDATNLRQLAEATGGRLQLPAEFLPPAANRPRRDLSLADVKTREPPFQIFGDDLKPLIAPLRFSGGLDTRLREGAVLDDIAAQLSDRSALLAFATADGGRLVVLNADLGASNLPSSPLFVPLIGELARQLVGGGEAGREALCGEPFVVPLPSEVDSVAELKAAGGESAGTLSREAGDVVWKGEAVGAPTTLQVLRGEKIVSALATAIPPAESDLRTLDAAVFQERLAGGRQVEFRAFAGAAKEERDTLWSWLAVGCVVCLMAEAAAMKMFRSG